MQIDCCGPLFCTMLVAGSIWCCLGLSLPLFESLILLQSWLANVQMKVRVRLYVSMWHGVEEANASHAERLTQNSAGHIWHGRPSSSWTARNAGLYFPALGEHNRQGTYKLTKCQEAIRPPIAAHWKQADCQRMSPSWINSCEGHFCFRKIGCL